MTLLHVLFIFYFGNIMEPGDQLSPRHENGHELEEDSFEEGSVNLGWRLEQVPPESFHPASAFGLTASRQGYKRT